VRTSRSIARTTASFTPSAGAKGHNITWSDGAAAELLEISIFDSTTAVDVPSLVALPKSGTRRSARSAATSLKRRGAPPKP